MDDLAEIRAERREVRGADWNTSLGHGCARSGTDLSHFADHRARIHPLYFQYDRTERENRTGFGTK